MNSQRLAQLLRVALVLGDFIGLGRGGRRPPRDPKRPPRDPKRPPKHPKDPPPAE